MVRRDDSVAAERGYLREAGNLVFHLSLLVLLLGVAIGGLFGFRGTSVVVVGQGFANTLTQYDDLTAGAAFSDDAAASRSRVGVKNFEVEFETGPVQRGRRAAVPGRRRGHRRRRRRRRTRRRSRSTTR